MISSDGRGLRFLDISLIGEEKPRKKLKQVVQKFGLSIYSLYIK